MNLLNQFYSDFPLTYLSRNLASTKYDNIPHTMLESKNLFIKADQLSKKDERDKNDKRLQIYMYLHILGQCHEYKKFKHHIKPVFKESLKNGTISSSRFGFISELDIKKRKEIVSIQNDKISTMRYQELRRFCFSRGIPISNNASHLELQSIAKWIERNEHDNINFERICVFMQQAIDLSVLAQNATRMIPQTPENYPLSRMMKDVSISTKEMLKDGTELQTNAAKLNEITVNAIDAKYRTEFQERVIKFVTERKIRQLTSPSQSENIALSHPSLDHTEPQTSEPPTSPLHSEISTSELEHEKHLSEDSN